MSQINLPGADDWHVNYIEQYLWYQRFRTSLDTLQALHKTVYLPLFGTPTQGQWEAAYTRQTGLIAPIIPGARLLWMDMKHGIIKPFTTSYDLNNGQSSSGVVYPMINRDYNQGSLRLIGTWKPIGSFTSPHQNIAVFGFPIDVPYLVSKGLVALWIFFRFENVAAPHQIALELRGQSNAWYDFTGKIEYSYSERDATVATAPTNANGTNPNPSSPVPLTGSQPVSPANASIHGMAMIYNPVPTRFNEADQEAFTPVNAQLLAVGSAASVASGTLKLMQGFLQKGDTWYLKPQVTLTDGTGSGAAVDPNSRAWAYALFQEDVGDMEVFL